MSFFGKRGGMVSMAFASVAVVGAMTLGACGGDAYSEYAAAYNQISAKGGIDANIDAKVTMDGETKEYSGNFKVDNTNNAIYYEMTSDGQTTTQFSDGTYLYTERGDQKTKYELGGNKPTSAPSQNSKGQKPEKEGEAPEFKTAEFLNEFSSFLDAGKIKELGLLEPIDGIAVSKTTKNGDVYTLEVADSIVKKFLNTMATEQAGDDTVQVTDLQNFTYNATVKDGVVTKTSYSGDMTVNVPGSLKSDGKDAEYTLNFEIDLEFVNPGSTVNITLPDSSEFKEVSGF